ncbi:hypothetical protein LXL04_034116 [Taraxacum kok-saghyz]
MNPAASAFVFPGGSDHQLANPNRSSTSSRHHLFNRRHITSKPPSPSLHASSVYEKERKRSWLISNGRRDPWKLSTELKYLHQNLKLIASFGVRSHLDSDRGGSRRDEASTVMRLAVQTTRGAVTALSFRTDGQPLLASGGSSGVISIWNLEKRRLQSVIRDAHDSSVI